MGRRKIEIKPLTDDRNRTVTFTKRKAGLFKKAHELAVLCDVDISVIIIGRNHKIYEYSSNYPEEILTKYRDNFQDIYESKRPNSYGNYELKSRILDESLVKNNVIRHRYSNSANNINPIPQFQSAQYKGHSRSKSEMAKSSSHIDQYEADHYNDSKDNANDEHSYSDVDDEDEDEEDDEENDDEEENGEDDEKKNDNVYNKPSYEEKAAYDSVHDNEKANSLQRTNDDTTISLNTDTSLIATRNKKRKNTKSHESRNNSTNSNNSSKKSKLTADSPSIYSKLSIIPPTTPESHIHSQSHYNNTAASSATVTPYRTSAGYKKSKGKDNKRPTLSLQIPTIESDNQTRLSNPSTITAAESSNKSNLSNQAIPTTNDSTTTTTNNNNNNSSSSNNASDNASETNNGKNTENNKIDGNNITKKNVKISGEFNRKDTNITLPSPIYNLNDSSSSNSSQINKQHGLLSSLPNMNNTPLPSALFKDRKALYTPTITNFLNNLSVMVPSATGDTPINQMNYFNFNNMSPTQLLTPMFPSQSNIGNNQQTIQGQIQPLGITQEQFNIEQNSSTSIQQPLQHYVTGSQPFLLPVNSATSSYFPQMKINTNNSNSTAIINTTNANINNTSNNNHNKNGNGIGHGNSSSIIKNANNTNANEIPGSSGEMTGLPSRYADFQSPSTMFTNDWQLPMGSTPISAVPSHLLPLIDRPSLDRTIIVTEEERSVNTKNVVINTTAPALSSTGSLNTSPINTTTMLSSEGTTESKKDNKPKSEGG
jgi:MADS-box transcription factor